MTFSLFSDCARPSFFERFARLGAILVAFLSCGEMCAQGGRLEIEPTALDFGSCGHRERPELSLYLRNTGDAPLKILETKVSCSCITLVPTRLIHPIPPGAEQELRVTMSAGRALGKLSKYLTIRTDGSPSSIRVPTRLSSFEGLEQSPREVIFEGVVGGDPSTRVVDVKWSDRAVAAKRSGPLEIEFVDVESSYRRGGLTGSIGRYFEHRIEDISNGKRLHITILPTHPEGRVAATAKFKINAKPFEVSMRGEMFRGVAISPRQLNFSRVQTNDASTFEESIVLHSLDGHAFQIERLEVRPNARTKMPGFGLSLTPGVSKDGKTWRLRGGPFVPVGALATGSFSGKLFVHTTHPEQPKIEISFFGFFRD